METKMIKIADNRFLQNLFPFMVCICTIAHIGAAGCRKPRDKSGKTEDAAKEGKRGEEEGEHTAVSPLEKERVKTAKSFLDLLNKDEFEKAAAMFDDTMRNALPVDNLAGTWQSIAKKMGKYQEVVETKTQQKGPLTAVELITRFENSSANIRVVINEKGQVGGFFIAPVSAKDEWKPPKYADPKTFTEVDVKIGEEPWVLPGTLTLPKASSEKPVCAAVLVHGSGPHDRDETIGPNKPFKDLAWGLASRGIAVLRYDKRTLVHGEKMVKEKHGITIKDETLDDALYAVDFLRSRKEIHPRCIVVVGHSLGGYVAPLMGERDSKLGGLVLLAANTRNLQTLILGQFEYLFSLEGEISEENEKKLGEIKKSISVLEDPEALALAEDKDLPLGLPAEYWKALLDYDLKTVVRALSMPILVLQGERDYQVTMEDFSGWKEILAGKPNVSYKSYPRLNHLFIEGDSKSTPAEYEKPGKVSGEVVGDIASFIKNTASK